MTWLPPTSDKYEYRCVEWRDFEGERTQETIDALIADGWELDGGQFASAGMFVDLYRQQLRRSK